MKRDKMWFMAEDDGGGGGGGDHFEPDLTPDGSANNTPEGVTDEVVEKPAFDPGKFAKEFGSTFAESFAKAQPKSEPKAEPKLSPEEAKKLLNVWDPSDEFVTKFGNIETQKAAFAEMRDALVKQMDTIAQMRLQQQREQLDQQYSPMVTAYQTQQQEAQQNRFDKTFPQLADPKIKQVLTAAAQSILTEKKQFSNEGEMFREVASRTEAIIKQFNPDFKLSTAQLAGGKAGRAIPTTTVGANGGGGQGGGGGGAKKVNVRDLLPGPTG